MKPLPLPHAVQEAFGRSDWAAASAAIESSPPAIRDQHRAQVLLSMALMEAGEVRRGANVATKAMLARPRCPMVHWVIGNALHRLGNLEGALRSYVAVLSLIDASESPLCCVAHKARARGLAADAFLHCMFTHRARNEEGLAQTALVAHLDQRGPGCYSIYKLLHLPEDAGALRVYRPVA